MEDVDFLHGESARAVRLQLDYLKPEEQLAAHGVRHSVVVFGSTRLVEPGVALDRVERAEGEEDFRIEAFRRAILELSKANPRKAQEVLMVFSDPTESPIDQAPGKGACGAYPGEEPS